MTFTKSNDIRLAIPRDALEIVFSECDRYDADETGGRILGNYKIRGDTLTIKVNGVIEPGPSARRTATYFKQDGAYQEEIFRKVEDSDPSVEHLGNWHTHHVNGLQHLSGGDVETYRRTVEHPKHNIDFFYALLVTERHPGERGLQRYTFKNYVLRRGDPRTYEIPADSVTLTAETLIWPRAAEAPAPVLASARVPDAAPSDAVNATRVYDKDLVSLFYPKVKPFKARNIGVYWRGVVPLVDGSEVEVVVVEDDSRAAPTFTTTFRNPPDALAKAADVVGRETFTSCRAALIATERTCNSALWAARGGATRRRKWIF